MIRRRIGLVAALVVGQTALLSVGLAIYHQRLTNSLAQSTRQQILASNSTLAEQIGSFIDARQLDSFEPGTPDWAWLQSVTERIQLPNNGFVCVVDGDGRLLCHPELSEQPEMAGMPIGHSVLRNASSETDASIVERLQDTRPGRTTSGEAEMPTGIHLIGATSLQNTDAKVLVHQHESGLRQAVQDLSAKALWIGIPVGAVILLSTGAATWLITRRYESRLEEVNSGLEHEVARRTQELTTTRDAVIFGLAKLSESRDTDTGDHLNRIRRYVELLADQLRRDHPDLRETIDDQWICDLALSSALHDIGKVGIPDGILLKPDKLTDEEFERMKQHTWIGGETLYAIEKRLGESNFLTLAREIAFAHHERWDGSGYPFGLYGEIIPLSARLVAIADVYDALTSKRPYKNAFSHEKAVAIIREGRGTHFDPRVVDAFEAIESQFDRERAAQQVDAPVATFMEHVA